MGSSDTAIAGQASGAHRAVALQARGQRDWPAAWSQPGEDPLASQECLSFGRFRLIAVQRLLLEGDTAVVSADARSTSSSR